MLNLLSCLYLAASVTAYSRLDSRKASADFSISLGDGSVPQIQEHSGFPQQLQQGGGGTSVIIITTNNGGQSSDQVWNQAPMKMGKEHKVTVGGDAGLVYTPDTINAAVGDMVTFTFMAQNHTVSQSSFSDPCTMMDGGLDSGFMPNPDGTVMPAPTMMFQVTSQDPVWMYCKQGTHCQKGMVFSINPTAQKSQAKFKSQAMASGGMGSGGMGMGSGGMGSGSMGMGSGGMYGGGMGAGGMASPSPSVSTPAAAASPPGSAQTPGYVTQGQGSTANDGTCSCSCLCGMSAFPAGAGQGMSGGLPGSMPMPSPGAKNRLRH